MAGVSRQAYSAVETGKSVPSAELALRLARSLQQPVEELFSLAGDGHPDPEEVHLARSLLPGGYAQWERGGAAPEARSEDRSAARPVPMHLRRGVRLRRGRIAGREVAYPLVAGGREWGLADGMLGEGERFGLESLAHLPSHLPPVELVLAGCDPSFALLEEALRREAGVEALWVPMGSRQALEALEAGEVHVAGVHRPESAWPPECRLPPTSGPGIAPSPGTPEGLRCTRVGYALWEEALLFRPSHGGRIGGIEDLVQPELRFLNREEGAGARAVIDALLGEAGIDPNDLSGYRTTEARGHRAVIEGIASGAADVGVAIGALGEAYGLNALALTLDRCELVIPDLLLELPAVRALLDLLRRRSFRSQLEALGGYDLTILGDPT